MRPGWLPAAAALVLSAGLAAAQDGSSGAADSGGGFGGPGSVALPSAADTLIVEAVEVDVTGSTGDADTDAALTAQLQRAVGLRSGDRLSSVGLEVIRARLDEIEGIAAVAPWIVPLGSGGRVRLVVAVTLGPVDPGANLPTGWLARGDAGELPLIWQDKDRRLRFILNTGTGAFTDGNPWFGSPETFTLGNPLV